MLEKLQMLFLTNPEQYRND